MICFGHYITTSTPSPSRLVNIYFPMTYSVRRNVFVTVVVERDESITSAAFAVYPDITMVAYFTCADWYAKSWLSIGY